MIKVISIFEIYVPSYMVKNLVCSTDPYFQDATARGSITVVRRRDGMYKLINGSHSLMARRSFGMTQIEVQVMK